MEPTDDGLQTLVKTMKALANPIRLRIIALLEREPKHAYALAKELGVSYPLAHLHMKGLKKMGLIEEIEQEEREGRPSVKTYAPTDFEIVLSSKMIHDTVLKEEEE
jgi:ArsR family transcriptional regulator